MQAAAASRSADDARRAAASTARREYWRSRSGALLDVTRARELLDELQQRRNMQAVASGGFGGSRHELLRKDLLRQHESIALIDAKLNETAGAEAGHALDDAAIALHQTIVDECAIAVAAVKEKALHEITGLRVETAGLQDLMRNDAVAFNPPPPAE